MQVRHHHHENLVSRHRSTSLQMLRRSFRLPRALKMLRCDVWKFNHYVASLTPAYGDSRLPFASGRQLEGCHVNVVAFIVCVDRHCLRLGLSFFPALSLFNH